MRTPATIGTSRETPRRTSTSQRLNVARSKTGCVWMKSTPALILSEVFARSASIGFMNGEAVAPMSSFGGGLISSPDKNRAWSRMPTAIFTRPTPSRSFTYTASGWLPCFGSSPLMNTKFSIPIAAAPSRSACRAIRFRSRPVIWTIGSRPTVRTIVAAGIAAMATVARLLSVTFTASTTPRRASARRRTMPAAALFGGFNSAVTTNSPDLRRLASALKEKTSPSHMTRGLPVRSTLSSFPGLSLGRNWHRSGTPPVAEASSGRSLSLSA